MSKWQVKRTEEVLFWTEITEDLRVVLANGVGVRVHSVSVRFTRPAGQPWSEARVSVSHGKGWDLTVTSVPRGLRRNQLPHWLQVLVAECQP